MKRRNATKALRLLTLLSFFHFSGLNNGFTMVLMGTAGVQPLIFTPVLAASIGRAMNPFFWKSAVSARAVHGVLFRSGRTLQISSRAALRKYHPHVLLNSPTLRPSAVHRTAPVQRLTPAGPEAGTGSRPDFQSPEVKTRSHVSLRRADQNEPEKRLTLQLKYIGDGKIQQETRMQQKVISGRQTSFRPIQILWRFCRGRGGEEDPASLNPHNRFTR